MIVQVDAVSRCLGLVTQYNPLQTAPGALILARNGVCNRENILEDRRGYMTYFGLQAAALAQFVYSNKVICHNGVNLTYDNSGVGANYTGTYNAPSGTRMRSVEAFSNCYITTDKGVQVLTDVAGTQARLAGAPRSLDPSYVLNAAGSGFILTTNNTAYRAVIQRTDANGNVLFGYPSQRMFVYNSAGSSKNVDITLYLPSEVTVNDIIQFYRTASTTTGSSDNAGEEMALVYQVSPTSTDISNGFITFTDSVIDSLRGATLYISPSQEGISQANDRPPLSKDIAIYKNDYMLYANTSTKQRLFLTLLGVSGLSGKTLALAGTTYNFGASEIISGGGSPQVLVSATGVIAVDIEATARSLVRVINRYTANTSVYAYYLSSVADLPGQIMIEEKGIGAAAFTAQSSDTTIAGMFSPPPPVSPATNTRSTSTNQVQKNGLYWAKGKQPEAVPGANNIPVGAANKEILRVVPLRDSAIIIKDDGVFRMTGDQPPFVVTPLDLTVRCKAPDSVAVLANTVICLSNQGVVQISDTGVQVISREIEPTIKPLLSYANTPTYTNAVGYESERSYLLSTVNTSADTQASRIFVYNIYTKTWMEWTFGFSAAVVEQNSDKLHFSKGTLPTLYRERKDFQDSDYCDPETAITIVSVNTATNTVVFDISGAVPDAGWVIQQNSTELPIGTITTISQTRYSAVMTQVVPTSWTTGAAVIFPNVGLEAVWDAWFGGGTNAGTLKQVSQFAILADNIPGNNTASRIVPTFKSNFDENQEEVLMNLPGSGWGAAWGSFAWGGEGDSYGYPTYVPRNKQICRLLNPGFKHKVARERLSCAGYTLVFDELSERIGR